ncbi:hypothetical protein B566_EDAN012867 [Ephemera danica]|nr:hypothetical protein B566_EDAN012867 [Ephemera danica]
MIMNSPFITFRCYSVKDNIKIKTFLLFSIISCTSIYIIYNFLPPVPVLKSVQQTKIQFKIVTTEISSILNNQRNVIDYETTYYNLTRLNVSSLSELVPEKEGHPLRVLIVSTWRSGSSFLGEVLSTYPGNWYLFEPLGIYNDTRIRSGSYLEQPAVDLLRQTFLCNYTAYDEFTNKQWKNHVLNWTFERNRYMTNNCKKKLKHYCYEADALSAMCKLFPLVSTKTVRLRLDVAENLLNDTKKLGPIKIIYLVRDPRGTILSRKKFEHCNESAECYETALLCADLMSEHLTSSRLIKKYPKQFSVLRYEDFSMKPIDEIKKLFDFLNLDLHYDIIKFINTHTNGVRKNIKQSYAFSTYRNSTLTSLFWRQKSTYEDVQSIQNVCLPAMKLWGYLPAHNESHMRSFNPLTKYYLTF